MKTSVIIPCFGQAEYLSDAIDSVLSQTKKAHQIIIINDGSKDETKKIAESYEDKILLINQVNKGLASARNTGIMNATGDYILPLDADDMFYDDAIETIEKVAQETNADIIAPSFKCFGVSNQEVILQSLITLDDMKGANRLGYFSAIKREALLECGGYSPRMVFGYEDFHLWFDLLTRSKTIVPILKPLVLYRVKEHSMIHDAMIHHKELMGQIIYDFPNLWPSS